MGFNDLTAACLQPSVETQAIWGARHAHKTSRKWLSFYAVPETGKRTGSRTAGNPASSGVAAVAPKPDLAESPSRLSAIWEQSKPYREIFATLVAIIVAISGGIAWLVAHFATQAQLHYLECRVSNSILTQLLPVHMEGFAGKIDWRLAQIDAITQHGGGTAQSISIIGDLVKQVNEITNQQKETSAKIQKEIEEINKKCISDQPQIEMKS